MQKIDSIICPECGNSIDVSSILSKRIEEKYLNEFEEKSKRMQTDLCIEQKKIEEMKKQFEAKEYELSKQKELMDIEIASRANKLVQARENEITRRIRIELEQENENSTKILNDELNTKTKLLNEARKKEIEFAQLERKLIEAENEKKLIIEETRNSILKEKEYEFQKKLQEMQNNSNEMLNIKLREKDEENRLREKENEKIINDLKKKIDDTKRAAEQGSMQMQGEVQELVIEEMLKTHYPFDEIISIKTGQMGADILQIVRNTNGDICGKILYESKRTLHFQKDWIDKLKIDGQREKAEILVIASKTMPANKNEAHLDDGVWICPYKDIRAFSLVLRHSLIRLQQASIVQQGKTSKMEMLYNYMISKEFRGNLEAIIRGFEELKNSYEKEKIQMQKIWKEREKQLDWILTNSIEFYGAIKGIAGAAIPEIELLSGRR